MGCDIHLYSEARDKADGNVWSPRKAATFREDEDVYDDDDEVRYEMDEDGGGCRNYALFGILANVRSNWGRFTKYPRGLPDDVSEQIQTLSDQWDSDGHSHSYWNGEELYATLADLDKAATQALLTEEHEVPQLRDIMQSFLSEVQIANSPDERIVFWFDN